jgi:hypothetical protein
MNFV